MKKQLYLLLGLIITLFAVSCAFGMDDRPMTLLPWESPAEKALKQPNIDQNNTWHLTNPSDASAQIRYMQKNGPSALVKQLRIANDANALYPSKIVAKSIQVLAKNKSPVESIVAMRVQQAVSEKEKQNIGKAFRKLGLFPALKELTIADSPMGELHENISFAQSLQKLQGTNLGLVRIPGTIGFLKQLRELNLQSNQLTELPPHIGELRLLEKLNLYGNQLTQLPSTIASLVKLQTLDIGKNNLKMIPRLKKLLKLPSLNTISAKDNMIANLQPEQLNAAVRPLTIELEGNPIVLPPQIGKVTLQMHKKKPEQVPGDHILVTVKVASNQYALWEKLEKEYLFEKQYESSLADGKEIALKIPDFLYGVFKGQLKAHSLKYEKTGSHFVAPSPTVTTTQPMVIELPQLQLPQTTTVNNNNLQQPSTTSVSLTQKRRLNEDIPQTKKNKIDDNSNNNNNTSIRIPPPQPLPVILPPPPNPRTAPVQLPASGTQSVVTNNNNNNNALASNLRKYLAKPDEVGIAFKAVYDRASRKFGSHSKEIFDNQHDPERLKRILDYVAGYEADYKTDPLVALAVLKTLFGYIKEASFKKEIAEKMRDHYNLLTGLGIKLSPQRVTDIQKMIREGLSVSMTPSTPALAVPAPVVITQRPVVAPVPTPMLPAKAAAIAPAKQSISTPSLLAIKPEPVEPQMPRTPAWPTLLGQLENTDTLPMAIDESMPPLMSNNNNELPPQKTTISMPVAKVPAKSPVKMPMSIPSPAQFMPRPSSLVRTTSVHDHMLKLAKQYKDANIELKEIGGSPFVNMVVSGKASQESLLKGLLGYKNHCQPVGSHEMSAEYQVLVPSLVSFIDDVESKGLKITYAPPQLNK